MLGTVAGRWPPMAQETCLPKHHSKPFFMRQQICIFTAPTYFELVCHQFLVVHYFCFSLSTVLSGSPDLEGICDEISGTSGGVTADNPVYLGRIWGSKDRESRYLRRIPAGIRVNWDEWECIFRDRNAGLRETDWTGQSVGSENPAYLGRISGSKDRESRYLRRIPAGSIRVNWDEWEWTEMQVYVRRTGPDRA